MPMRSTELDRGFDFDCELRWQRFDLDRDGRGIDIDTARRSCAHRVIGEEKGAGF